MTRIDEIRERLDQITPGPWVAETSEATMNDQSQWRIGPERELPVVRARMSGADAEFIANAPADLAWCLAKLDAIRALHKPFEWSFGEGPVQSCSECARLGASEEEASYPCPTIRALNDTKEI